MRLIALLLVLLAGVTPSYAAPFDGSKAMQCSIQTVLICNDPSSCVRGTAATALLPPVVLVDVPGRRIGGDASGRTVKIVSVGQGAGRLLLHGDEAEMSGTAWNIVVEQASGAMTGAVLTRAGGYLVFGTCREG
jgi:hypothetical protein